MRVLNLESKVQGVTFYYLNFLFSCSKAMDDTIGIIANVVCLYKTLSPVKLLSFTFPRVFHMPVWGDEIFFNFSQFSEYFGQNMWSSPILSGLARLFSIKTLENFQATKQIPSNGIRLVKNALLFMHQCTCTTDQGYTAYVNSVACIKRQRATPYNKVWETKVVRIWIVFRTSIRCPANIFSWGFGK